MGLWDAFKGQLIDIIEWNDDTKDTMVWRFPRRENEIKNGAKLVVRESQMAAFVNQGQLADVFHPGMITLETKNMPILSDLMGWKYGFNSPFKAEVYFVSTKVFSDRKFGTKNPIMLRDAEFGMVRLRAFGNFSIRISDAATFIKQIAGTGARFTLEELDEQLRDMVSSRFADALGQSKIPALDLAGNYEQIGQLIAAKMSTDFQPYGLTLVNLFVENISLPPEVEAAMDKRTSMGVIGNMQNYTAYQTAEAIPDAARNSGGLAGSAAGMAIGIGMGNQIAAGMSGAGQQPQPGPSAPPPLPTAVAFFAAIGGAQAGPFDVAALTDKLNAGQLTRETLVWKQGMPQWTAAGMVPELRSLFASVPPPLPPHG